MIRNLDSTDRTVSVIGKINDIRHAKSMDVKKPGDLVYLLGVTADELGGSEYYAERDELGAQVPRVDAVTALERYRTVNRAQEQDLIASCHDLSDGGLAVAVAESAFAGGYGMKIELDRVETASPLRADKVLFSESQSRLLVTVRADNQAAFEQLFSAQSCSLIGQVTEDPKLVVNGTDGEPLIRLANADLKESWQAPLREM